VQVPSRYQKGRLLLLAQQKGLGLHSHPSQYRQHEGLDLQFQYGWIGIVEAVHARFPKKTMS
jgi:hypothetical protein